MSETITRLEKVIRIGVGVTFGLLMVGCESTQRSEMPNAPLHEVKNVYRSLVKLPAEIRRVAILPISIDERSPDAVAGRETFQPILFQEALQTHEFEPIEATSAQLNRWFGRASFAADEVLPANLLDRIEKETGCNAVLLCRLSSYHPYPPVVEGWSMKLVWCKNAEILWTVEDIFDLSDSQVAASARREFKTQEAASASLVDPGSAMQSPRKIAQFSLRSLFGTMPKH